MKYVGALFLLLLIQISNAQNFQCDQGDLGSCEEIKVCLISRIHPDAWITGHAWVEIRMLNNVAIETYSVWPNNKDEWGVVRNHPSDKLSSEFEGDQIELCTLVDHQTYQNGIDFAYDYEIKFENGIKSKKFYKGLRKNNCTDFSTELFAYMTDIVMSCNNFFGITDPKILFYEIQAAAECDGYFKKVTHGTYKSRAEKALEVDMMGVGSKL